MSAEGRSLHTGLIQSSAREIARIHRISTEPVTPLASLVGLEKMPSWLERARECLAKPDVTVAKAAEWLLDNAYLVQRAVRQIRDDLPASFYAQLPALEDPLHPGAPRVYAVARTLLNTASLQLTPTTVVRFVNAYQERAPLDLSELWALPVMLRLVCLEELTAALARLEPQLSSPLPRFPLTLSIASDFPLEDTECVARATRALTAISDISWPVFVRETSAVEKMLAMDPAGTYARMDFDTRDHYRNAVEQLARRTRYSETEIAERTVEQARRTAAARGGEIDGEDAHVGYWLVDSGRHAFEASLGYRPSFGEWGLRLLERRGEQIYLIALLLVTMAVLAPPAGYLYAVGASLNGWIKTLALSLLPASMLAVTTVHWVITLLLPPRVLPKLDFSDGIPPDCRTAVVIPTLLQDAEEVDHLLQQIECRYLCNPDPALRFALLSDFVDASAEHTAEDEVLLNRVSAGIRHLNARHRDGKSTGPFHLLHRERRYNPREGCWMGWERKRGKLEQFNQLLAGEPVADFTLQEGSAEELRDIRFVITLDTDTQLPRGAASRLVGALAHPLNRARFDEQTGRLGRGYAIVQPRVAIAPQGGRPSLFTRFFCGDTEIDIYSNAVSDAYQDLLGTGIYVGKGIYDVDAFRRCLAGCAPENTLVSHDLFEGIHARVALASDIVLYEEYPPHYLAYVRRLHRWVRGDWQLQPWLGRRVPRAQGEPVASHFSAIDRWKMLDNLRRSLIAPSLLLLLVAGWLWLPGSPVFWTLLVPLAPAGHLVTDFASRLAREQRRIPIRIAVLRVARGFRESAGRWVLLLAFLPFEAANNLDAALRALIRVHITHRHLLSWTTAAHTAGQLGEQSVRLRYWREMAATPLVALFVFAAIASWRPLALPVATPLLLAWLLAPELAYRISQRPALNQESLDLRQVAFLRRLARRTWLYFETFVGPNDHWLPPDNYQEEPRTDLAHRTSPTNIGMMLLSNLAAWDLGYLGLTGLSSRLRNSFETLEHLEHYRGHLLNWYDTQSLEPLQPRYVSTVDSGNLAGALLTVSQGCVELHETPILTRARWDGLVDTLAVLDETLKQPGPGDEQLSSSGSAQRDAVPKQPITTKLIEWVSTMTAEAAQARDRPETWQQILDESRIDTLDQILTETFDASSTPLDAAVLRELRIWIDRVNDHLLGMRRDIELLLPWHSLLISPPTVLIEAKAGSELARATRELARLLHSDLSISALRTNAPSARVLLEQLLELTAEAGPGNDDPLAIKLWVEEMEEALTSAEANGTQVAAELSDLASAAASMAKAMDFRLLYDEDAQLFFIGYNLNANRLDPHHYDLLASEARLASFIAIAMHQVPVEHWFALGRPITRQAGSEVLLSWGGTLFEYLMPTLLLSSHAGTLLFESQLGAVAAQIAHGAQQRVPWGTSESGFAVVSADQHYQYRAFGTPGLGLKRGLAEDLVVAPYATGLALPLRPRTATENLERLNEFSMTGAYGFYEAIDFTPERLPSGKSYAIVRSYMAHHQGMMLAALDNLLCNSPLSRRFHSDPSVQSADLLLHERAPLHPPVETPIDATAKPPAQSRSSDAPPLHSWRTIQRGAVPEAQVLGNGRLSSLVTDSGAGKLSWQGFALTRWVPDSVRDSAGLWIYVRDEEDCSIWSTGRQPTGNTGEEPEVLFHSHAVEFHRRDHGIALRTEIFVAPGDDIEIRLITIRNETPRVRTLSFTSYAEIVLAPPAVDGQHIAFSKLFVESEHLPELDALIFCRRPRTPDEHPPYLMHRLVTDTPAVRCLGIESDRARFLGRWGSERAPAAVMESLSDTTGTTLDPILSVRASVELAPHATERLAFVTLVAGSRESLIANAERFDTLVALDWVLESAAGDAQREAQQLTIRSDQLPSFQKLLSLLLYPNAALRCTPDQVALNQLPQPRLWSFGISGDLPILLLRLPAARDSTLMRELVCAHQLWRRRGIAVDLVILSLGASSYAGDDLDELRRVLRELDAEEWLGRDGGIRLLRADQLGKDERRLLEVTARAILDADGPGLEHALAARHDTPLYPPAFVPTHPGRADDPVSPLQRPQDLLFDNSFGGFSRDGSEYWIHLEPGESTPAPWCNVLANEESAVS